MLKIKSNGQVVGLTVKKQVVGDDWLLGADIKIKMVEVNSEAVKEAWGTRGLAGFMIKPDHAIQNCTATLTAGEYTLSFRGADIAKAELTAQNAELTAVTLTIQAHTSPEDWEILVRMFKELITVDLTERQLSLATG